MQKISIILASFALMLVLGAGCSETEPQEETQSKTADVEMSETPVMETTSEVGSGDIQLTAKATGKNTVALDWKISKALEDKAESWRIVYGKDANPSYPSTWWFERSKSYREKVWAGLPAGKAHFRICAVVGETCDIYSNDVELEIPGAPATAEDAIEDETEEVMEEEVVETPEATNETEDVDESSDEEIDETTTTTDEVVEDTTEDTSDEDMTDETTTSTDDVVEDDSATTTEDVVNDSATTTEDGTETNTTDETTSDDTTTSTEE
mgnify:CR=1 FL=1